MKSFVLSLAVLTASALPAVAQDTIRLSVPENGNARVYDITPAQEGTAYTLLPSEDAQAIEMVGPAQFRFRFTPDFENPKDVNRDNIYSFSLSDAEGVSTSVEVAIIDMPYCGLPDPNRAAAEVSAHPCRSEPVFYTRGAQIFDPNGEAFVARGINLQYGDDPDLKFPSIRLIKETGSNMVRLQIRRDTSAEQVRAALDEAVAHALPVMVFFWEEDITCKGELDPLIRDVETLWLDRWLPVLSEPKYQPYLMLNIANEWGRSENGLDRFVEIYSGFIKAFRLAGYRAPIVIDAGNCGQDPDYFTKGRGRALVEADPLKNVIVSVHAYHHLWNSPGKIDDILTRMDAEGVPYVLGEFGDSEFEASEGMAVDHRYLMRALHRRDIGWLMWSWKGNGASTRILDMSDSYDEMRLNRRGFDIVNGPYGLKQTSKAVRY